MTSPHHIHTTGDAIRALREMCNPRMPQSELARRLDISPRTMSRTEADEIRLSLARAVQMSEYMADRVGLPAWRVLLMLAWPDEGAA